MTNTIHTTRAANAHERAEMSVEDYRQLMRQSSPRRKYNNRRSQSFDGRWFDSAAERDRYEVLSHLMREGEISDLECQPVLVLQDKFKRDGKTYQAITYRADFAYTENGKRVIEDVKGGKATQTSTFRIKWKMALKRYPEYTFRLEEVR